MKMVTAHVGSGALVRLTGRLDGKWLATFDEVRGAELLDGSAAEMLERQYV